MERLRKEYVSPQIEVIQMENEGVIATSGNINGMDVTPWSGAGNSSTYGATRSYSAPSSDLEDMINDILTVGE